MGDLLAVSVWVGNSKCQSVDFYQIDWHWTRLPNHPHSLRQNEVYIKLKKVLKHPRIGDSATSADIPSKICILYNIAH